VLSKKTFVIALSVAAIASVLQLVTGHGSANGVAVNQPAKLAAFEGHYNSANQADLYIFGWVDHQNQKVYGPYVPGGLSFLLHNNFDTKVPGLNDFPKDEIPTQVNAIFQFYHLMVAFGLYFIGISLFGIFLWWRGKLFDYKWLLRIFVLSVILPQLANQFGWFSAEMGRQPWVVYGLLRTSDAFSAVVTANQVLFSLIMFTLIYALLFVLFLYLLDKKIKAGPFDEKETEARPLQESIAEEFQSDKTISKK
jgi:cytochrome d ubiquinol oxidase subunit I